MNILEFTGQFADFDESGGRGGDDLYGNARCWTLVWSIQSRVELQKDLLIIIDLPIGGRRFFFRM